MARDVRSCGQEVEISSEAFASLFAVAASTPADTEGLLFGRVRRPAVREQWSDGDAPSNAAEKDRPCMVVESFYLLGILNDTGTLTKAKPRDGDTKPRFSFSEQVKNDIRQKCSESGGQKPLGICCTRANALELPTGMTSRRELQLMLALRDAISPGGWFNALEGVTPITCCFQRDTQVGDLGAFVCTSVQRFIDNSLPAFDITVNSIGKTVEAEPAVPRLPPANISLLKVFDQAESTRCAIIGTLESSVVESFKILHQERLDELGAGLHDAARLADGVQTQASVMKEEKAPLEAETKPPEQTAPQPPVPLAPHTQQDTNRTADPSDRKRKAELEPEQAKADDPRSGKQNQSRMDSYLRPARRRLGRG